LEKIFKNTNSSGSTGFSRIKHEFLRYPTSILALFFIFIVFLIALGAPYLAPFDPLKQTITAINKPPGAQHLLGTDQFGRDVLSRIIFGSRNSLIFGVLSPFFAAIIGTFLGVAAGFFGGWVDRIISRIIDLLLSFPELLLAILIAAALGGGFWNVVVVITIAFVPSFARLARAQTMATKQEPYIEAAIAIGVRVPTILFRHILPNIFAPILALMTIWVASAIRLEATLSFLGIGTRPPQPSWGNIIRDGLDNLFGSPWPIIGAGLAITAVILAFNLVGDAFRDWLDPTVDE
jgi:peptide/nickel transport system permease protein